MSFCFFVVAQMSRMWITWNHLISTDLHGSPDSTCPDVVGFHNAECGIRINQLTVTHCCWDHDARFGLITIDLIKVPTEKKTCKYTTRLCNIRFFQLQPLLIRPAYAEKPCDSVNHRVFMVFEDPRLNTRHATQCYRSAKGTSISGKD